MWILTLSSLYQFKNYLLAPTIENKHYPIHQNPHGDEESKATASKHSRRMGLKRAPSNIRKMSLRL